MTVVVVVVVVENKKKCWHHGPRVALSLLFDLFRSSRRATPTSMI
jgi:hypothetical protein